MTKYNDALGGFGEAVETGKENHGIHLLSLTWFEIKTIENALKIADRLMQPIPFQMSEESYKQYLLEVNNDDA